MCAPPRAPARPHTPALFHCAPVCDRAAAWALCGRAWLRARVGWAWGCAGALRAPLMRPHSRHSHPRAHTRIAANKCAIPGCQCTAADSSDGCDCEGHVHTKCSSVAGAFVCDSLVQRAPRRAPAHATQLPPVRTCCARTGSAWALCGRCGCGACGLGAGLRMPLRAPFLSPHAAHTRTFHAHAHATHARLFFLDQARAGLMMPAVQRAPLRSPFKPPRTTTSGPEPPRPLRCLLRGSTTPLTPSPWTLQLAFSSLGRRRTWPSQTSRAPW